MLYMPKTRLVTSTTRDVLQGYQLQDEGSALVSAGNGQVTDSAGAANEVFMGFSLYQRAPISTLPRIQEGVVPAVTFLLATDRVPVGGTLVVRNTVSGAVLVSGTDYTAVTNTVGGQNLTFTSTFAGIKMKISYEYSPSFLEAETLQGDIIAGGTIPPVYNKVGVISQGDIFTSRFDTTVDWTLPNLPIYLGASGKISTTAGSATRILNAYVIEAPTPEIGFLGICLR